MEEKTGALALENVKTTSPSMADSPVFQSGVIHSLMENLTVRQKTYIVKLGSVKGRDVVPIDLILYRELVKLELVVDKGRRLALSKLGHEIFTQIK